MRPSESSAVLLGLLVLFAAPAAFPQRSACQTVEFSAEVKEKFPGVREGCLEVIERAGEKYAVFKADLVRTTPNSVSVRFKRPDGSRGDTRTLKVKPDRRVLVNGEPVRVDELAVGQELTAYVRVTEPQIALAPATATEPLDLQPLTATEQRVAAAEPAANEPAPAMPETASYWPLVGFAGFALLLLGSVLTLVRRFGTRR